MVKYEASDEWNYILFTEGYLPRHAALEATYPKSHEYYRKNKRVEFACREHALAWLLSAFARRLALSVAWRNSYGGVEGALNLPLDTWVAGPSESGNGPLDPWFQDISNPSEYRLILHRMPTQLKGRAIRRLWHTIHYNLKTRGEKRGAFRIRHHPRPPHYLEASTKRFLTQLLSRYQESDHSAEGFLQETSHTIWYGDGRIQSRSQT